jgi:hypothetical protein
MSGPYTITGVSPQPGLGTISHWRDTAKDAVSKAVEMMGQGMQNVSIVDAQRRTYRQADFAQLVASEGK